MIQADDAVQTENIQQLKKKKQTSSSSPTTTNLAWFAHVRFASRRSNAEVETFGLGGLVSDWLRVSWLVGCADPNLCWLP